MDDQAIEALAKRTLIHVILPHRAPKLVEEVLTRSLLPHTGSFGTLLSADKLFLLVQQSFYPSLGLPQVQVYPLDETLWLFLTGKERECWHMLLNLVGHSISAQEFGNPLSGQDIQMVKKAISRALAVCRLIDLGPSSIVDFTEAILSSVKPGPDSSHLNVFHFPSFPRIVAHLIVDGLPTQMTSSMSRHDTRHVPTQDQSAVVTSPNMEYDNNVTNPIRTDFINFAPSDPPQAVVPVQPARNSIPFPYHLPTQQGSSSHSPTFQPSSSYHPPTSSGVPGLPDMALYGMFASAPATSQSYHPLTSTGASGSYNPSIYGGFLTEPYSQ
ncbi:hypothetical protein FRC17_004856 [Serendipita sp. 399]|nr:hypothetical protein FRC17_004856 [Serendipita sp. 399]